MHDSWYPRSRIHKEHKSASLLIPSIGRDKLSPLMKSFHRLHVGSVGGKSLSMWTVHTLTLIKEDLDVSGGRWWTVVKVFVHTQG